MNEIVCRNYKTYVKNEPLLPVGYLVEGEKSICLLLAGKHKSSGTKQTLKGMAKRKKMHSVLNLFK